jgi:hypothetical protein
MLPIIVNRQPSETTTMNHRPSPLERLADVALACTIGIVGAWWLVTWWTA